MLNVRKSTVGVDSDYWIYPVLRTLPIGVVKTSCIYPVTDNGSCTIPIVLDRWIEAILYLLFRIMVPYIYITLFSVPYSGVDRGYCICPFQDNG